MFGKDLVEYGGVLSREWSHTPAFSVMQASLVCVSLCVHVSKCMYMQYNLKLLFENIQLGAQAHLSPRVHWEVSW